MLKKNTLSLFEMEVKTRYLFLVCGFLSLQACVVASDTSNATMSTLLETIFKGYDKKLPPNHDEVGSEKQVLVTVNMYVNSMYTISEMDMDYSMSIFLRERWVDERLKYNESLRITRIVLDNTLFGNVWMPDMYILNEKASDYHEVMVTNKLIHIYPDGTIQHSARVTGTFSCLMHLQKYPFDTQYCKFEVESYGHSTEDLKFIWSENAVSMAKNIEFPQFSITKIKSYSCEKDYYGILYPCIGLTFVLERSYAYYIIQIYIPSLLIVVLSWVSFWLDPTSVPARISLGLLTVLTMTTQSSGARANLPRVSYVKAIDVYMATCITFVFLALVEFAFVNVLTRNDGAPGDAKPEKKDEKKKSPRSIKVCPQPEKEDEEQSVTESTTSEKSRLEKLSAFFNSLSARLVDQISRILFPLAFAIFNLVYWIHYFFFDHRFEDTV